MIVYDDVGRVVDANQSAADLIGVTLAQLRGMHMRDFYHPDELPAAEERLRTIRVGEELRFERWLRCCNRRYVRVAVRGIRRDIGGYRSEYIPLSTESIDLPARLPTDESQDLTRR